MGAVNVSTKVAVVPELFWTLVASVDASLLFGLEFLLRTSSLRTDGLRSFGRRRRPLTTTFSASGVGIRFGDFV